MAATDAGSSPRNHFLWLGPLIAVPAFFSYYTLFVQWPVFRDTAWLNIGVLLVALGISIAGLRRAWSRGVLQRIAGVAGTLVSAALATVLVTYCYVLSYRLPSADLAVAEGQAIPALTLISQDGTPVDLAAAASESLVLVFYRGFW